MISPKFGNDLLGWFRKYQRDLPWRLNKDPYRIWLSEIMLQQTRVAAVIPYYERFLERFPKIRALAEAPARGSAAAVVGTWLLQPRAQFAASSAANRRETRRRVSANRRRSAVRCRASEATRRPRFLSIAFGAKHAVLDGNVARVLARLDAVHGDLRESGRWQALQKAADELLDPKAPSDWNQAMMELGRDDLHAARAAVLALPGGGILPCATPRPDRRSFRKSARNARPWKSHWPPPCFRPARPHAVASAAAQAARKHATHEEVVPADLKDVAFPDRRGAERCRGGTDRDFLRSLGALPVIENRRPAPGTTGPCASHGDVSQPSSLLPYRCPVSRLAANSRRKMRLAHRAGFAVGLGGLEPDAQDRASGARRACGDWQATLAERRIRRR